MTEEKRVRPSVLIPNAFTTASMLFGFYSIQQSFHGNFIHATWALLIAAILDSLDGRIARMVKGTSEFGEEYDSLADLVSFGIAPAILAVRWGLEKHFGELGWAIGFIYVACTAIRLARFNVLIGDAESKSYFKGMPSPTAAGIPVVSVMVYNRYVSQTALEYHTVAIIYLVAVGIAGVLMVSPIRFRTFKDIHFTKYGLHWPLLGVVAIITCLFLWPQATLFGGLFAYLGWAFLEELLILRPQEKELRAKRREARRKMKEARRAKKQAEREARMRVVEGKREDQNG